MSTSYNKAEYLISTNEQYSKLRKFNEMIKHLYHKQLSSIDPVCI